MRKVRGKIYNGVFLPDTVQKPTMYTLNLYVAHHLKRVKRCENSFSGKLMLVLTITVNSTVNKKNTSTADWLISATFDEILKLSIGQFPYNAI